MHLREDIQMIITSLFLKVCELASQAMLAGVCYCVTALMIALVLGEMKKPEPPPINAM